MLGKIYNNFTKINYKQNLQIKIFYIDGLFLGDEFAAQDLEFLMSNKVNNVINWCGGQLNDLWVNIGVNYLTFQWPEDAPIIILDKNDLVMKQVSNT